MQLTNKKHITFPAAKDGKTQTQTISITNLTLGKGAFGEVRFAYDAKDAKKCYAIKIIDRQILDQNKKNLTNLANEIAIMADIRSEYVVALNNATKSAGSYYLLMELCNGGDLANFVK
jgi:serine/threonine-protein kinase ULK/ATG1